MIGTYNPVIVLISYGVSFLGAYTAICACEQLRIFLITENDHSLYRTIKWYFMIGASLGGVGIWGMHFIGMGAVSLHYGDNEPVNDIRYNLAISLLSLIVAVAAVVAGVVIASKDRLFAKTKSQILDILVDDFHLFTLSEIRQLTLFQYFVISATTDLKYLAIGGVVAASGVCVMHYIGMESMEFHGNMHFDMGIVAASVCIAVVASIAAFWILFRLLSIYSDMESLRLLSAAIMGIAVCGMHYCGMVAADFQMSKDKEPEELLESSKIHQNDALYPVLFAALIVLWIFTIIILADLRYKYSDCRKRLNKALKAAGSTKSSEENSSKSNAQSVFSTNISISEGRSPEGTKPYPGVRWNAIIPGESRADEVNAASV